MGRVEQGVLLQNTPATHRANFGQPRKNLLQVRDPQFYFDLRGSLFYFAHNAV